MRGLPTPGWNSILPPSVCRASSAATGLASPAAHLALSGSSPAAVRAMMTLAVEFALVSVPQSEGLIVGNPPSSFCCSFRKARASDVELLWLWPERALRSLPLM